MGMICHFRDLEDDVYDDGFGCDVVCGDTGYEPSGPLSLEECGKVCVIPRLEYDNCGITKDMMRETARKFNDKIFTEVFGSGE